MANNYWEYGQGYPLGPINNQYTGESDWFNNVNEPPMGPGIINTGMGNQFANARQRMTSDDAYRGTFPGQRSPHTGFEEMQFDETVQAPERTGIVQTLKGFATPTMNFFKKMVEPNTAEENFGREYFKDSMDSSGRVYNNAGDLFGGKNVVSAFGKGMGAAGQKRIDTINATLAKWEADEEKYANQLRTTTLYDRRNKFQKQLDAYNRDLSAGTGGADIPLGPIDTGRATTTGGGARHDYGRDRGGGYTLGGGFTGTRGQVGRTGSSAGVGRGHHSWRAEGGRIGYQDGELVEDEYMAEATPRGMMEENIEEVQGEPTREQLEAIAFEIFRLPLEELNEEQLNVVYQAAMEQEPSEEEVQFAAQECPGQGIASLV